MSAPNIDKEKLPTKLLWVDLEMTGLNLKKDVILEIAAEVTDFELKTLASYEAVISHPEDILTNMDAWSQEHHEKSGLIDRIRKEGRDEKEVIREFIGFIQAQFNGEPAVLAGNSIHNDRSFIRVCWPEVESLLHYRVVDVSSFKIVMNAKYGVFFQKNKVHRAFDDIQASIAELQHYLQSIR